MRCPPPLILKHLISSVVSLAQLVSSSAALPAELVPVTEGSLGSKLITNTDLFWYELFVTFFSASFLGISLAFSRAASILLGL